MEFLFNTQGPLGRAAFAIRFVIILVIGSLITYGLYKAGYKFLHFTTVGVFWALIGGFFTVWALTAQTCRRLQDIGISGIQVFYPVYNLYILLLAFIKPGKLKS